MSRTSSRNTTAAISRIGEEIEPTGRPGPGPTSGSRPRDPRRGPRTGTIAGGPDPNRQASRFPLASQLRPEPRIATAAGNETGIAIANGRIGPFAAGATDPKCPGGSAKDWWTNETLPPSRRPARPEPAAFEPSRLARLAGARAQSHEAESAPWAETLERDWEMIENAHGNGSRSRGRERQRERESRQDEPEEPRWLPARPLEPFES